MTLPTTDTIVTYPAGATEGDATVLHVEPVDTDAGPRFAVLLDTTPVHPVDAGWPDQPADRATLSWGPERASATPVLDAIVAATDGGALHLGRDIPVRKGTEGWAFVVAHLVDEAPPEGAVVSIEVDPEHRRALSLSHTACHLASLALNRAVASRWRKEVRPDALGAPDFDAQACETSRILERGSLDTYRLGKSLRKAGFTTEGIEGELSAIEAETNAVLTGWVAEGALVRIERNGELLTDRRFWVCSLAEGEARIACGGTHASSLGELGAVSVSLGLEDVEGTPVLTMRTTLA
jgi:alanyl-tRNA synthetase